MKLVRSLERAVATGTASTSPCGLLADRLSVISNSLRHSVNFERDAIPAGGETMPLACYLSSPWSRLVLRMSLQSIVSALCSAGLPP